MIINDTVSRLNYPVFPLSTLIISPILSSNNSVQQRTLSVSINDNCESEGWSLEELYNRFGNWTLKFHGYPTDPVSRMVRRDIVA